MIVVGVVKMAATATTKQIQKKAEANKASWLQPPESREKKRNSRRDRRMQSAIKFSTMMKQEKIQQSRERENKKPEQQRRRTNERTNERFKRYERTKRTWLKVNTLTLTQTKGEMA